MSSTSTAQVKKTRRYDIDWIRVIVFDILIFYHVGMFFVEWPWHIKNNELVNWIQYPMLFTNQWRIPILFVVSGMGTRFALSYKSGGIYARERITRLLIPLVFGMLFIVAPQVYLERVVEGQNYASFFHFYPDYFNGIYPEGNFSWHHLWFLPYLLLMSLLATPLFLYLRKKGNRFIESSKSILDKYPITLYLAIFPLLIVQYTLAHQFPVSHALIGDWYALAFYALLFVMGYILICCGSIFWKAVEQTRWISLGIGLVLYIILIQHIIVHPVLFPLVKVLNMWAWILTIFGFAAVYLNKESDLIKYRNKAVYPFYILHQTITIICGYYLMNLDWHYGLKMLIMVLITFGGSFLIYHFIILKIKWIQVFFGVK